MRINRKQACEDMHWAVVDRDRKPGGGEFVAGLFHVKSDAELMAGLLRGLGWEASVVALGGGAQ